MAGQACTKLVLGIAHDKSGHTGMRRLRDLIVTRFTWPNVARDCELYCKSCVVCAKANKAGNHG